MIMRGLLLTQYVTSSKSLHVIHLVLKERTHRTRTRRYEIMKYAKNSYDITKAKKCMPLTRRCLLINAMRKNKECLSEDSY